MHKAFSPADMSFTSPKSAFFDNSDDDSKPTPKSLNQSDIIRTSRGSAKIVCAHCSLTLTKSKDMLKCAYCHRTLCKKHCAYTWKTCLCCNNCYTTFLANEQRGKGGDHVDRVKKNLEELEREHRHRQRHNKELETQVTKLQETLRQRQAAGIAEHERMQERLNRECERNEKVQSQISRLELVLEDAARSEADTLARTSQTEAQLEAIQSELAGVTDHRESAAMSLQLLNDRSGMQLNIKKFLDIGCRTCKKRFVNAFKAALMRSKLDVESLSFMQSVPTTPRSTLKVPEKPDRCGCRLM
jgi:uncharacterized protein YlxW (UPF0749 family)